MKKWHLVTYMTDKELPDNPLDIVIKDVLPAKGDKIQDLAIFERSFSELVETARAYERQVVITEIEGLLVEKEVEYEDNLVSQEISFFIAELRAKLVEMKEVRV